MLKRMKKSLIVIGWIVSVQLALIVSLTTVAYLRRPQRQNYAELILNPSRSTAAIATAQTDVFVKGITTDLTTDDARPILIEEFLKTHSSPLTPYDYWGKFLTSLADKYQLDYRLLPSIAMQESNLCKKIPAGTFNCLGLGIHSRGTWGFPTFESNFEKAAEILRKNYVSQGLITPDQIQDKYTPSSNGSWEFAVNRFMDQLETADF
jgi:hypothetical protein